MKVSSSRIFAPLALSVASLTLGFFTFAKPKKENSPNKFESQIQAALPEKSISEPAYERKILIFSVTHGYRHKSISTGQRALQLMGEKTGAYQAVLSNDLANFEKDKIQKFDTIVFLSTTGNVFRPKPKLFKEMGEDLQKEITAREKRLQKNLLDFIKSGKGFVGIHAASDTYYTWPEYGDMLGAYFDGHPWLSNNNVSIAVEKGQQDHPLVAHLNGESLNFKEDIYQFKEPYDSSTYDMLLRLDPEKSDKDVKGIKRKDNDFGVSWTKAYGCGRVFYSSLGHNDHIFYNDKVLLHFLSGIQYAIGDLTTPKK